MPDGNTNIAVVCAGGSAQDCQVVAEQPLQEGTSNPVSRRFGVGGVARNVAEGTARLGIASALVSRIGRDQAGRAILAGLDSAGVETSFVALSERMPTATYTAVLQPDGELFVGLSDMAINTEIVPDQLLEGLAGYPEARVWFLDANLPASGIKKIAAAKPNHVRLAADCVSITKSVRLRPILGDLDFIFANCGEAEALSAVKAGPTEAARALVEAGAKAAIVPDGAAGVAFADRSGAEHLPAMPCRIIDVTGAGDALVSGALASTVRGAPLREAVRVGMATAALVLESALSVPADLSYVEAVARATQPDRSRT